MGLFGFLKKHETSVTPTAITAQSSDSVICSPVSGTKLALTDVEDPVFASGIMGPGLGIKPVDGVVYAPVSGVISATTATWHAIGMTAQGGAEVLIHVGIDTVEMAGEGFVGYVTDGQHVEAGEPLMKFDRKKIEAAGYSDVVICVVTNGSEYEGLNVAEAGEVTAGDPVIHLS